MRESMIRSPEQLQSDELFRAELRRALEIPALQSALASLRNHRGLFRTGQTAAPANVVHHSAVWTGGFNAALDALESMILPPRKKEPTEEPWGHITPTDT